MKNTSARAAGNTNIAAAKTAGTISAADHRFAFSTITLILLVSFVLIFATRERNGIYLNYVTLWGDIVKQSPTKRRAHENLGQALSTVGRLDEALEQFKAVLALPDDGSVPMRDLYREIGVVYFRQGLYDASIDAWMTGLRFAPYDPSLLNNLSIAQMQTGRFDEAAVSAETALKVNPNMPQVLSTMGQIYIAKKEFAKALKSYLQAIELEPDSPMRYWNVAVVLGELKRFDEAESYAARYQAMEPDPRARQNASQFLMQLKESHAQ